MRKVSEGNGVAVYETRVPASKRKSWPDELKSAAKDVTGKVLSATFDGSHIRIKVEDKNAVDGYIKTQAEEDAKLTTKEAAEDAQS